MLGTRTLAALHAAGLLHDDDRGSSYVKLWGRCWNVVPTPPEQEPVNIMGIQIAGTMGLCMARDGASFRFSGAEECDVLRE